MERGVTPEEAAQNALAPISRKYPTFSGALIVVNKTGQFGKTI